MHNCDSLIWGHLQNLFLHASLFNFRTGHRPRAPSRLPSNAAFPRAAVISTWSTGPSWKKYASPLHSKSGPCMAWRKRGCGRQQPYDWQQRGYATRWVPSDVMSLYFYTYYICCSPVNNVCCSGHETQASKWKSDSSYRFAAKDILNGSRIPQKYYWHEKLSCTIFNRDLQFNSRPSAFKTCLNVL